MGINEEQEPERDGTSGESHEPVGSGKETGNENEALFQAVEDAFKKVDVVSIYLDYETFQIISLQELSMESMLEMASADGKEQMKIMYKKIKTCLVDPEQWTSVRGFNFDQFTEFVKLWMKSSGVEVDDGRHE